MAMADFFSLPTKKPLLASRRRIIQFALARLRLRAEPVAKLQRVPSLVKLTEGALITAGRLIALGGTLQYENSYDLFAKSMDDAYERT
jgi:hypothetical protein